jgi:hypothetical protein
MRSLSRAQAFQGRRPRRSRWDFFSFCRGLRALRCAVDGPAAEVIMGLQASGSPVGLEKKGRKKGILFEAHDSTACDGGPNPTVQVVQICVGLHRDGLREFQSISQKI